MDERAIILEYENSLKTLMGVLVQMVKVFKEVDHGKTMGNTIATNLNNFYKIKNSVHQTIIDQYRKYVRYHIQMRIISKDIDSNDYRILYLNPLELLEMWDIKKDFEVHKKGQNYIVYFVNKPTDIMKKFDEYTAKKNGKFKSIKPPKSTSPTFADIARRLPSPQVSASPVNRSHCETPADEPSVITNGSWADMSDSMQPTDDIE